MFRSRKNIAKVLPLSMMLVIFISVSSLGLIGTVSEYNRFEREKKEVEESFLRSQKALINEVLEISNLNSEIRNPKSILKWRIPAPNLPRPLGRPC